MKKKQKKETLRFGVPPDFATYPWPEDKQHQALLIIAARSAGYNQATQELQKQRSKNHAGEKADAVLKITSAVGQTLTALAHALDELHGV